MMYFTYRYVEIKTGEIAYFLFEQGRKVNFQYWNVTTNIMMYFTYRNFKAKIDE